MISHVPGPPNLLLGAYDISLLGYSADEYFVSGTATASSGERADYTTRVVTLTPPEFNGTVVVEWLNVSGGIDAPAVWFMAHRELVRAGYGYIAVSVQRVGVEGGDNLVGIDMSLKAQDAERYSPLNHPGDAYAYDIYTRMGRLVRDGEFGLRPEYVLAVGESQSAMFLTTYVNDVDAEAAVYDGFLVHSRFGTAAPLDGSSALETTTPAPFRDDLRVPVLTVITETDLLDGHLLGYRHARRPDDEHLRAWELPGSAHADNYTIKVGFIDSGAASLTELAAAYAPTDQLMGQQLSYYINFAPQHHYVLQAAVAALHRWVRDGVPPSTAPPLELADGALVLDANGLATGGVRIPWVDVPAARTSGTAPDETPMSFLFGSGEVFDAATLAALYPAGSGDYLARFETALDQTIRHGFLLAADRAEILDLAAAMYPG
ncbi:alpha/beta hydrolase domain-containing protein [Mycolicibacterium arenosum]|uniref:Alpha/beta hydrolase domain-containing protein n=1 Tax=Mycolicibacterium arenosum TaxID=2952157 RepID=A0ABT1M2M3_9MYCO|nr:alpha/beta hydrolase domain-containing protein [Mycolicibacterium sp. CAU 1645]MCP9272097.1 alpha/beta hydrolase domain-containing protein [Mycolicibacterium sp. CAU 1645]